MLKAWTLAGALGAPLPLAVQPAPVLSELPDAFALRAPLELAPPLSAPSALETLPALSAAQEQEGLFETAPRHREALERALELARSTRAGRAVLKAVARRGRPLPVRVRRLHGDLGAYDYLLGVLLIDPAVLAEPGQAAATLVHELRHVLQHDEGLPAEALELELDAHLLTLEALDELGREPDGFSAEFRERARRGPEALLAWLRSQLPSKFCLLGSDMDAVLRELRDEVAELEERLESRNSPSARLRLAAARRDLRRLRSPEGRAAYERFSRQLGDRLAAFR